MPRPDLGRRPLQVRLTPQARAMLGDHPSERARELVEAWAAEQAATVCRTDVEALMAECVRTDDGWGVELCGRALTSDEGSPDWAIAVALVLRSRDE